jgi:hypothetical protein
LWSCQNFEGSGPRIATPKVSSRRSPMSPLGRAKPYMVLERVSRTLKYVSSYAA